MSRGPEYNVSVTSGWVYKEWANDFYRRLKPREHFAFYATQFPYFNNDLNVRAPKNARLLMRLCGGLAVEPFAPLKAPSG